ncbi:hypothetical protein AOQ84DRAFT_433190 [Glonium stellatum]|uniref:Uncharacterized protein n=1 Tax=Glonium stellatum TaxID=574774 RepID=A0A8E2EUJ4_9PEZI|nr:hypothetical protein AOQ84DRAFT_433190 [Glonium stellatum]
MPSSILAAFLGALQASVSVLLTISYGVIVAQFNLLSESSAKDISKTCVRIFLPALLIHNVGSQLHLDTVMRYLPILVWSIIYNTLSLALGATATRLFGLPSWVTPAIAFNNTTSLPLLLIQSLDATGILSSILIDSSDTTSDAVNRAKSYFLVNSIVGNSLTFALGPKLLNAHEEDAPDSPDKAEQNGNLATPGDEGDCDVEHGRDDNNDDGSHPDESTSLLPNFVVRNGHHAERRTYNYGFRQFSRLPTWCQKALNVLYQFCNAPVIGAVIGAIIGLAPPLHRAFFADTEEGGFFKAWLTTSVKNIGDLFAALQVIVVGVKLAQSLRLMKRGEDSGNVPWRPAVFVMFIRFVLWPLISIPFIWALATKTSWLSNDPILWFAMMLMPTGPPAMKLTALADVNGSGEEEKLSIAKFLTLSYAISPLICFAVVGGLRASEAAVGN